MIRLSRRFVGKGLVGLLGLLICSTALVTSQSALAESDAITAVALQHDDDPLTSGRLALQTEPDQAPAPSTAAPEVGPVVVTDATLATFPTSTCPTGRNKSEPVGEGYIMKVTGPCYEGAPVAVGLLKITDIIFPDGEVRLDLKVVTGQDRASFILGFREQLPGLDVASDNYQAIVLPGVGWAMLFRGESPLVSRKDLGGVLSRDDWNTVAVRTRGPDIWMLVNDQLVAQARDSAYDRGYLFLALRRIGEVADSPETAAVLRNIRISRLASEDPARTPAIQTQ